MEMRKKRKIIGWLQISLALGFMFIGQTDFHIGAAFIMLGQGLVTLKIID